MPYLIRRRRLYYRKPGGVRHFVWVQSDDLATLFPTENACFDEVERLGLDAAECEFDRIPSRTKEPDPHG